MPVSADGTLQVRDVSVPAIGFGTYPFRGDACADAVADALAQGYRQLDTAQSYGNEADVGRGLARSGVPRDQVFLVTKVHPSQFAPDDFARSVDASLARLGVESVDLLLLHWASPDVPLAETLGAARDVQARGLARHLGVSNFTRDMVDEARRHADLFATQMEAHPFHPQDDLVAQARDLEMLFTAYTPLDKGRVAGDPTLAEIGARRGKTAAQTGLRWLVQRGLSAIPKASSAGHRAANLDVFDFDLTADEMATIHALSDA